MAKKRGKKNSMKKTCPFCDAKVKKLDRHVEKEHPLIWESTKVDAVRERMEVETFTDQEKLEIAEEFFEMEEYMVVMEILKHIDPTFPDMVFVYDILGRTFSELGSFKIAEHYLKKAIDLRPEIQGFRFNLALMHDKNDRPYSMAKELGNIDLSKAEQEDLGMIKEIIEELNEEMEELSKKKGLTREQDMAAYITFSEGYELMLRGDCHDSIEKFEEALVIDPGLHSAFGNIGFIYIKLGDYKKARQYLDRALSMKPDYVYSKNNLELLEKLEKGEFDGDGFSLKFLSEAEKKMIPQTEITGDGLEIMMLSEAFYMVKDVSKVRAVLEDNEEFQVVDEGEHFIETLWMRGEIDPDDSMSNPMGIPINMLGTTRLCRNELNLSTMTRGRLRVLQHLLLENYGLRDILEDDGEYFE